jgi:hypothetical protein
MKNVDAQRLQSKLDVEAQRLQSQLADARADLDEPVPVPVNTASPYYFSNDIFEGALLFKMRPSSKHTNADNSSADGGTSMDDGVRRFFAAQHKVEVGSASALVTFICLLCCVAS